MKYWAYINNEILGPYEKDKLFEIPDFNPTTLICPQTPVGEKTEDWKEAATYPEISALLNSPKSTGLKKENSEKPKEETQEEKGIEKEPRIDKAMPGAVSGDDVPATTASTDGQTAKVADIESEKKDDKGEESPPLNQLKPQPLSASPLMEEIPSSMAPANNFEVNKLSSIKPEGENALNRENAPIKDTLPAQEESPAKEEAQIAPTQEAPPVKEEAKAAPAENSNSMESAFDPISLSQINRKTMEGMKSQENTAQEEKAKQEEPSLEKEEPKETPQEEVIAPIEKSPEVPKTPDIVSPAPIKSNAKENVPVSPQAESEIYNKLNELSQNSISKSDLSGYMDPINKKLAQIDQSMSGLDNASLANEVKEMSGKLKHMENIIDEIKLNMSIQRKPEENTPQKESSQDSSSPQGFALMGETERIKEPEPVKPSENAEDIARAVAKEKAEDNIKPEAKEKNEIIDEGEKAKDDPKKESRIKTLIKPLITVVLLAAVLVATAIALKQAGIIDLTKILPLPAALTGDEPQIEPTPTPINQAQGQDIFAKKEVKDIKPEIIFFTRTYSNKNGSKTIENQIIDNATKMKGDPNLIEWQATKVSEGVYTVHATVPVPSKQTKINYIFEINYNKKTMKPLNTQAKNILDNLFEIIKPKKKAAPKKRAAKSRKSSGTKRTYKKPAKKSVRKPVVKESVPDDEYEYVYEDEEEDDFEDDFILPGVPGL